MMNLNTIFSGSVNNRVLKEIKSLFDLKVSALAFVKYNSDEYSEKNPVFGREAIALNYTTP